MEADHVDGDERGGLERRAASFSGLRICTAIAERQLAARDLETV
jgi:hypothetical protein